MTGHRAPRRRGPLPISDSNTGASRHAARRWAYRRPQTARDQAISHWELRGFPQDDTNPAGISVGHGHLAGGRLARTVTIGGGKRIRVARENPRYRPIIPMPTKRALTVLVIDDEALLLWSMAELLRCGGHTVIEAASAAAARDAMQHTPGRIDLVLLDYHLPDSNDLRFLEEVRRRLPQASVVLMSGLATPDVVQGAMDRGARRVLSKPFDMDEIEALVSDACRPSRDLVS